MALFLRQKKPTACTAAHCLAEVYAVLTGMPGKDRATSDEALLFLDDVAERLAMVTLDSEEYFATLRESAALGISGGTIYDALIARCASKAKVDTLYTWNVQHFSRLGAKIASRVRVPHV